MATARSHTTDSDPDVALPHVRKGQDPAAPQKSMPYQDLAGADGACGVLSTVNDLAKWDAMWANEGKLGDIVYLSKGSYTTITSSHLAMGGRREGAGLGWFIESNNGEKVITHSGGMPGFILNHAVGGWPGDPPSDAAFPANFETDWVRVWQPTSSANPQ